jgi:hypothetical protein
MDQIIPEDALPIKMAAFGHCFRTEAGSAGQALLLRQRSAVPGAVATLLLPQAAACPCWSFFPKAAMDACMMGACVVGLVGSASRGLYRVHQFSKVEMFVLSTPRQSEALLQELVDIEEEIFTELGLHFKILVRKGWTSRPCQRSPEQTVVQLLRKLSGRVCLQLAWLPVMLWGDAVMNNLCRTCRRGIWGLRLTGR